MSAYRLLLTVDLEAEDMEAAGRIAEAVYEASARPIRDVPGVRWLLPVGDIREREPFATPPTHVEMKVEDGEISYRYGGTP